MSAYLDSSALVKLVVAEDESLALRRALRRHPSRVSSALARVEVVRAIRAYGAEGLTRARAVLRAVDLVPIDDGILDAASRLDPAVLRSLDAIHLASALRLAGELEVIVTYDRRMAEAATALGLAVAAPA